MPVLLRFPKTVALIGISPMDLEELVPPRYPSCNCYFPVDDRFFGEDVVVVRHAKADSDAVVREPVEAIGWHATLLARSSLKQSGA